MLRYYNYDIVFQEIPDEVTLAVNITGCPNHCIGCHSPHLQKEIGEELSENVIDNLLCKYGSAITCFCFMGGDACPKEIDKLASYVHKSNPSIKVGWYSGRPELPSEESMRNYNFIKLGRYDESRGGLKSKTTNQRLYAIDNGLHVSDITGKFWR
ncbi:MAG: anaerobic ribonucleoside-triphosphate reductase activating protein [Bacteroidales bacterium]|nr:anaerobic ribonucleoside-triphosphate reductase activating protein [Bacteroidales bacterium]